MRKNQNVYEHFQIPAPQCPPGFFRPSPPLLDGRTCISANGDRQAHSEEICFSGTDDLMTRPAIPQSKAVMEAVVDTMG